VLAATIVAGSAYGDSLFTQKTAEQGTLVSLKKARFEIGDIITVLVKETVDASTDANTNTKKESDLESQAAASNNSFLVSPKPNGLGLVTAEKLPNWQIGVNKELRATGKTLRKDKLVTTVACCVTGIHDNGNIEIEGHKALTMNREETQLYVRGIVRARDVTAANTIDSVQIANATIDLRGRGPLSNNQRRGLLTKLVDWLSPY
jgi:flagellar L-ring protein precursor FlgH